MKKELYKSRRPLGLFILMLGVLFLSGENISAQTWNPQELYKLRKSGKASLQVQRDFSKPQNLPFADALIAPSSAISKNVEVEGDQFWSENYGLSGTDGNIISVLEVGDKIYAAGEFTTIGNARARNVAMWDGQKWHPVGDGFNGPVAALVWHQGQLYAGGYYKAVGKVKAYGIARWDGNQWHPVSNNPQSPGLASGFVQDFISDEENGKLYISGSFTNVDGVEGTGNIAVWDGTKWAGLAGGSDGGISASFLHDDKLFISGVFSQVGRKALKNVAYYQNGEWHQMGTTDQGADTPIFHFALEEEGGNTLLAGGMFVTIDGKTLNGLARYDIDSKTWSAFTNGENIGVKSGVERGEVKIIKVVNGSIYIGGQFDNVVGTKADGVAVYTKDKGFRPIGTGLAGVNDLLIHENEIMTFGGSVTANGMVHGEIDGEFTLFAGDSVIYGMARAPFDPANPTSDLKWRTFLGKPFFAANGYIRKFLVHKGELYVAGSFTKIGHDRVENIARWNGKNWVPLAGGLNGANINDMVTIGDDLYVGGSFSVTDVDDWSVGSHVARWDGQKWHALGRGVGGYQNSEVYTLATDGTNLYVAGILLELAGNPNGTDLEIANIAKWDGRAWSSLGSGLDLNGRVYSLLYHEGALYAGGGIRLPGNDTQMSDLSKWDGQNWSSVGQFNHMIRSMIWDEDNFYVGGLFNGVNGESTGALVKGTGDGKWEGVGNISGGTVVGVTNVYRHNGLLFVGGVFQNAGDLTGVNGMAYLNRAGEWKAMGSGVNGSVYSMLGLEDQLWVAGGFTFAGGKTAYGFTTWRDPGVIRSAPLEGESTSKPKMVRLFPNPAAGMVNLVGLKSNITRVILHDLSGKVILNQQYSPTMELQLSIANLAPGLYIAEIYTNKGKQVEKLVVR
ncbi:T9SS type A sorting domain-containing protein [Rufibacter aurantiacus]|uniref:T9SS type A sorting domain-containing protein n=1 Tax=Rufibacter aurantiacus TaxID=2817374 RepID=UPI001B30E82D|nr:T9SS type A sorting domain-containing protein [Rufibacter aurantiacus]